jgi:excisionase family DNA binding protein
MGMEQLLTIKEAAAALRIHPETLKRWMGKNDAPTYVRMGRKIFFREVALREFIDKKEVVW